MHRLLTFALICLSARMVRAAAYGAQSLNPGALPTPVPLRVEFHSGEVARYTFAQAMNLTTRVDPSVPGDRVASFMPRRYEVTGEIVATFASTGSGELLRGTVEFRDLTVKNWIASAPASDLQVRLRALEAAPIGLTMAADGNLKLADLPAQLRADRYVLDVEDLYSLAQAVLISRLAGEPLAPGQQRESTDFPIPGLVKPGMNMTVRTEYLTNVSVASQPNAEVRLSMLVPNQSHPVSPESSATSTFERFYAVGDWTYLLDLRAQQISFLHKTIRTETGYSVESADSNEEIRIPRNLFTVEKQYSVTARRVAANDPPARVADLAALEKSLAATGGATNGKAPAARPGGEVPLGDVARHLRDEHPSAPPAETGTPSPNNQ